MGGVRQLLFLLFCSASAAMASASDSRNMSSLCSSPWPDLASLPSDRLTVMISSHDPSRWELLSRLCLSYSSLPFVSSVVVLWSNPSVPPPPLPSRPKLHLLSLSSPSLNLRFLPLRPPLLLSRFVAISDDDISPPPRAALSLALSYAASRPLALLGFFPRAHALHLPSRSWIYAPTSPSGYSILLSKLLLLRADYLHKYSCRPSLAPARALVDRLRNCEDILMNFLAAAESGQPPLLVSGGPLRDFGDPRNSAGHAFPGISSRRGHWPERASCITRFHRLLGAMPLRYSRAMLVPGARDPSLCRSGRNLLPCHRHRHRHR